MNDLESKLADLALNLSTLKGHWDNGLGLIQRIHQEISLIKQDVAILSNNLSNHQIDLKATLSEFSKLKSLVTTIREEFSRNLTTESLSLLKNIEDKHSSVAKMVNEHDSKISHFETLVDEMSIDAKNAILKADNADMMVMLNKKKLENIQLLVQNQQLKK